MSRELFPLRIVTGDRFCNRVEERRLLTELIEQKRPTTLISPRRYGKSSLVHEVTAELGYPFCAIDFLTAYNDESICLRIIKGVSELASKIMPINMKTINILEKCFHGMRAVIKAKLIELEFATSAAKMDPALQVLETLRGLEHLANKLDKTVIVFMDEFQRISETEMGEAIQGSIRNVAQTTKNIAFVFSGSSRHMLLQAFDDSNQPLYMMCEKIFLERIAAKDYIPYIQDAAKIKWATELAASIIDRIITLSEEHPFYVNYLCGKLWQKQEPPKNETDVDAGWHECLISEERRLIEELDKMTLNQRVLLKVIAQTPNLKEPTAYAFLNEVRMSSGTATPILKKLKQKDMIYVDKAGTTKVLDPLIKSMLNNSDLY